MNVEILKMEVRNAARRAVKNADAVKFDGAGYLMYQGKPLMVENESMADLIIRKYKARGVNLRVVIDHREYYFKKA